MQMQKSVAGLFLFLLLLSCSGTDESVTAANNNPPVSTALPANTPFPMAAGGRAPGADFTWQIQLQPDSQGRVNTSYAVQAYDLDMEDNSAELFAQLHAQGRYVICYFSAGTYEPFRSDAAEFQSQDLGQSLAPPFDEERWLDIRSSNVQRIMRARMDRAKAKGCDAIDADNMDGYLQDTGFSFSADDQLTYNRFIANEAHSRALAALLKNDIDQIPQLVSYYDGAINEQCHAFEECAPYSAFVAAGKPVFNIEYEQRYVNNFLGARTALCNDAAREGLHTLVLPVLLDDSFRRSCEA